LHSPVEHLKSRDLLGGWCVLLTKLGAQFFTDLLGLAGEVSRRDEPGPGERPREDERLDAIGAGRREHDGGRSTLTHTHGDGLPEARSIHHCFDLGGSIVNRANLGHRIGKADPSLVKDQDAAERAEMVEPGLELRQRPHQLDMAHERTREHEVRRALAEHLVRKTEVAAARIGRLRHGPTVEDALGRCAGSRTRGAWFPTIDYPVLGGNA
jgi:hypothetical protein